MSDEINKLKEEVWELFQPFQEAYLGTCDGEKPFIRPITLIHFDKNIWIGTGTSDAKIKQIIANSNVEFCLPLSKGDNQGYIRGSGIALIIEDKSTKNLLANTMPYFNNHWKGLDDPNYTLIKIDLKEIEYLKPGEYSVSRFSL